MARIKYSYNSETCKYEPVYESSGTYLKKTLLFLFLSFTAGLLAYYWHWTHSASFDEQMLLKENLSLKTDWEILEDRTAKANDGLEELIQKDDHNYRVILDSQPLPPSIREAGIGGSEKIAFDEATDFPQILDNYQRLLKLKHQTEVEMQSYDELHQLLQNKIEMWASRPAIQPINNKQLDRLHLTFGSRFHPIFHIVMGHKGLDFAAAKGTPVYATGDGKIEMAYFSGSYGNVIFLNHGHDYETRYAHLSRFAVVAGQLVKRGQIIGYVGNTGNSVSHHLHYEVLFKGRHVNPINFFQRDLNNNEYEKLIREGSQHVEPLD